MNTYKKLPGYAFRKPSAREYIAAFDQGTTSSRCIIFDEAGQVVASSAQELARTFPANGWVEQDPQEIWSSQLGSFTQAMAYAGIAYSQIAAIGITNQRETTIVWDRVTGVPLCNAIVWQCRRSTPYIDELEAQGKAEFVRAKTGLIPDAYFSATKIAWILDNVEGAREKAAAGDLLFGTVDTWLIYKLTGGEVHATDYTNASRTMLFNIHTLEWDQELLDLWDIPRSLLPEVRPSVGDYGTLCPGVSEVPIAITGVLGDQQAALFGQCCFEAGSVKNTYGTGCFMLMNTGEKSITSTHGLITTIGFSDDSGVQYALEGSVFNAGSAIKWLVDELRLVDSAADTEAAARVLSSNEGVYLVPAFSGLGAPHWNQKARGVITGLTQATSRNHIVRATLESLAYQTCDVLRAMQSDAGEELSLLRVDGGVCVNDFVMQMQADTLGIDVVRPAVTETTALGAAYAAGLSIGYWKSREELLANYRIERTFVPEISAEKRQELLAGWNDAVKRTM